MSENVHEITPSDPPPSRNNINYNQPEKETWPELVGLTAEEADKKIKEEMEGAFTPVIPENSFVTTDYRTDRVRLYVDGAGKVTRAPRIG